MIEYKTLNINIEHFININSKKDLCRKLREESIIPSIFILLNENEFLEEERYLQYCKLTKEIYLNTIGVYDKNFKPQIIRYDNDEIIIPYGYNYQNKKFIGAKKIKKGLKDSNIFSDILDTYKIQNKEITIPSNTNATIYYTCKYYNSNDKLPKVNNITTFLFETNKKLIPEIFPTLYNNGYYYVEMYFLVEGDNTHKIVESLNKEHNNEYTYIELSEFLKDEE